jgi:hypothetical protein
MNRKVVSYGTHLLPGSVGDVFEIFTLPDQVAYLVSINPPPSISGLEISQDLFSLDRLPWMQRFDHFSDELSDLPVPLCPVTVTHGTYPRFLQSRSVHSGARQRSHFPIAVQQQF